MLSKNSFREAEWSALRDTPHLVGAAVMMAGSSGLGTLKESFALAQSVLGGQSSGVVLIRDLSNTLEAQAAQGAIRQMVSQVPPGKAADELRRLSLERTRSSMALIASKGAPDEASAFRDWIWAIAEGVAKAAKEGGFLGFGGTEVSAGEQAYLSELKTALERQERPATA